MGPTNPIVINALAATTNQFSSAIDTGFAFGASFIIVSSSGSNSGTLQIQCSNDPTSILPNPPVPINWINVPGTSATAMISTGTIGIVSIPQSSFAGYRWLRVTWTPSSGAGTITVYGFVSTY